MLQQESCKSLEETGSPDDDKSDDDYRTIGTSNLPVSAMISSDAATTSRTKRVSHKTNEMESLLSKVKERERNEKQKLKASKMIRKKKKEE